MGEIVVHLPPDASRRLSDVAKGLGLARRQLARALIMAMLYPENRVVHDTAAGLGWLPQEPEATHQQTEE